MWIHGNEGFRILTDNLFYYKIALHSFWKTPFLLLLVQIAGSVSRQRPYHVESTGSRPITEVKQRRA